MADRERTRSQKPAEPGDGPIDPERGDAILRRMLKMKPKPHEQMVKERKNARIQQRKDSRRP